MRIAPSRRAAAVEALRGRIAARLHPDAVARWRSLRADPSWTDPDVPAGRGRPVLLVGGFGAGAAVMAPLRGWLGRVGYGVSVASLHRGVDCSERSAHALERTLAEMVREVGQPVLVVAHSRGGQFARVVAVRRPDLVAALITLGTPFRYLALRPRVLAGAALMGTLGTLGLPRTVRLACVRGRCCARFRDDLIAPFPAGVPFVSIYSRRDTSVRWETCLDPAAEHVEVEGSHTGLLVNAAAYRAIASAAADAPLTREGGG